MWILIKGTVSSTATSSLRTFSAPLRNLSRLLTLVNTVVLSDISFSSSPSTSSRYQNHCQQTQLHYSANTKPIKNVNTRHSFKSSLNMIFSKDFHFPFFDFTNIVLHSRVLYSRDNVGGSQGASIEICACHGTTNGDVSWQASYCVDWCLCWHWGKSSLCSLPFFIEK